MRRQGGSEPETATSLYVVARTVGEPLSATSAVQQAVRRLNRSIAIANVRSMERRLDLTLANRRFTLWLLGGFAVLALVLGRRGERQRATSASTGSPGR